MGTSVSSGGGSQQQTGTRNVEYNLISVAYHALQGAETIGQYMNDAQGDQQVAQFFQQVQGQYRQAADQAKQLLQRQLGQGGGK